ncbi:hypothetical protein ACVWYN_001388 [Pedobacter sp. UYP24]
MLVEQPLPEIVSRSIRGGRLGGVGEVENPTQHNDTFFADPNLCQQEITNMKSNLVMYLNVPDRPGFMFSFYSRKSNVYVKSHLNLVSRLQRSMPVAVEQVRFRIKNLPDLAHNPPAY